MSWPTCFTSPRVLRCVLKFLLAAIASGILTASARAESGSQLDGSAFFERKIRPALVEHCYACHSAESETVEGDLRLDQPIPDSDLLVPEQPDQSLLIEAIRYTNSDLQMPPEGRLPADVVRDFEHWVRIGAPDPRQVVTETVAEQTETDPNAPLWSFQPVAEVELPFVSQHAPVSNAIDRFVTAQLDAAGVKPLSHASRSTLARRAYFDLLGLPPSPAEVAAFVQDPAPNAFAALVDRLLASPHYGERWGRHWLDVARYGDCNGADESQAFPHAYHYRNYVIHAFNQDLPYDAFLTEQLAGDLEADRRFERDPGERIIGTGFLSLATKVVAEKDFAKMFADIVDEQIDTFGRVTMGLTLGCARCHDHKFDPISINDYYALAGVFHSTKTMQSPGAVLERTAETREYLAKWKQYEAQLARLETKREEIQTNIEQILAAAETVERPAEEFSRGDVAIDTENYGKGITIVGDSGQTENFVEYDLDVSTAGEYVLQTRYAAAEQRAARLLINGKTVSEEALARVTGGWYPDDQQWFVEAVIELQPGRNVLRFESKNYLVHLDHLKWTRVEPGEWSGVMGRLTAADKLLEAHRSNAPQAKRIYAVTEGDPHNVQVHIRGNHLRLGDEVPRHVPVALRQSSENPIPAEQSGREQLAAWLTSRDHPLTARVMVNRIWRWHFGQGIVPTPDNFGRLGEPPTHPELLDYLAAYFMEHDWSIKAMHRLIMTSATYQRAGRIDSTASQRDPENRLLWRFPRRRLEVEAVRDAMLVAADRLDRSYGDAPLALPTYNLSPEQLAKNLAFYESSKRRSVYLPVLRTNLYELFALFDFPNPDFPTGSRAATTIPTQALMMMNSPFFGELSREIATSVCRDAHQDQDAQVDLLYSRLFSRKPTVREKQLSLEMLERFAGAVTGDSQLVNSMEAWTALCHSLIMSNEFIYVD